MTYYSLWVREYYKDQLVGGHLVMVVDDIKLAEKFVNSRPLDKPNHVYAICDENGRTVQASVYAV